MSSKSITKFAIKCEAAGILVTGRFFIIKETEFFKIEEVKHYGSRH